MLRQLPDDFSALVLGASGGIGHAVLKALLDSRKPKRIIAVSRHAPGLEDSRLECLALDITTQEGQDTLAAHLKDAPLHLIFNAIGMLHDGNAGIAPEKRFEDLDFDALARLFHVNAATPVMLFKTLKGSLLGKHPIIFASLSARVGSIEDNGLGGWYAYRASKAAHNMFLKTAAIELKRLNRQAIVLCLHPGTTDTDLSQPFQARVPEGKLFTASFVAEHLLDVMDRRTPDDSGSFWDWAGEPIVW
ncbi:SDR family NAD(P)-dependent oxidoreductase [Halomonas sp. M20]|uniref:SDR family NAD(P)-dependent oxidoreductase n=1 Tax=Halomonas sp. M20 TaxID=2763264 RepID=UPI001D0B1B4C|nr:SDR family NAD(P)-dependent oxidoreductase [Halomonas sp. M20]